MARPSSGRPIAASTNSARMNRRRRLLPWRPCMSIAASLRTSMSVVPALAWCLMGCLLFWLSWWWPFSGGERLDGDLYPEADEDGADGAVERPAHAWAADPVVRAAGEPRHSGEPA